MHRIWYLNEGRLVYTDLPNIEIIWISDGSSCKLTIRSEFDGIITELSELEGAVIASHKSHLPAETYKKQPEIEVYVRFSNGIGFDFAAKWYSRPKDSSGVSKVVGVCSKGHEFTIWGLSTVALSLT